ncbi:Fic family protein, partial [Phascolarctobacterium succinatutens]|uniref:Fic family protein n=3 Tax=Phascolarctobacterium succinatutens TaxID=626940 RepID=UPI003AF7446F
MLMANSWYEDLNAYIRLGEPKPEEKTVAWQTAIGLQAVDGLTTSEYLLETAKENIEGKITIKEANARISNYYEERSDRHAIETGTKEADIVAGRITVLLAEKAFSFTPAAWMSIHRYLFKDVFMHAGEIRTYNISKNEWVLNGKSVFYASYDSIPMTMEYVFKTEKAFSYQNLSRNEIIKHLAQFTCDIWQIHPFGEGNTRSTAVFLIKYLSSLGYSINHECFAKNSWYFRNALVRANYNDFQNDIYATTIYL